MLGVSNLPCEDLHDWSVSNHLKLNPVRRNVIQVYFVRTGHSAVNLCIAHHHLEVVNKVKLFGVTIQNDLKWGDQIDNILKEAMVMLRKLKTVALNSQELLIVYSIVFLCSLLMC